jgi:polyphosphate kinase
MALANENFLPLEHPDLDNPKLYLNRELGQLEFFWRVLAEARDERSPLLERIKFLSIVGSNVDEFFMVRVAGLRQQVEAGVVDLSPDGMTPPEQLVAVRKSALKLMAAASACFQDLLPRLDRAGIHILDYGDLNPAQQAHAREYFDSSVFPVLTPLAVDPGRPFPHISNLSLNLAVLIEDPHGHEYFARVKVPSTLPRLVPVSRALETATKTGRVLPRCRLVWLEQLISAHLDRLFPGMRVIRAHPFRVTRHADIVIQELEADDLLETIEQGVRQRRFGPVVCLTVDRTMPAHLRGILVENLEMDPRDVYTVDAPLGLSELMGLYEIDRYDLKETPFVPRVPPALDRHHTGGDVFAAIRQGDILLHHPYDSFEPVVDFLQHAARDPGVLAIKQTLYRVGRNSPVVEALLDASENGKQVAVLVELKARFDEESNIGWARALEAEGVHVVYGLLGLKTHSKIALVVRKEGDQIRRYVHLATGNYNAITSQLYTDLGMFTCDEEIGADATDLFNYLTGYSAKTDYRKLIVAPINLRSRMEALIRREIAHQQEGRQGHLIFKMNALVDRPMIELLYQASRAGVVVDLLVRGICCLRPGVPGVSDNIRALSVVGRFLEHSRIYYFRNGGAEEIYLGSADLMPRNIDRRVEVLFPVSDPAWIRYLRDEVLAIYLADNVQAYQLLPDGAYERLQPSPGEPAFSSQSRLLAYRAPKRETGTPVLYVESGATG